jgi:exodeoxyribonuclease VIII
MILEPGIHRSIPMREYLALDALGSTELSWLSVSALNYRYMKDARADRDTESTLLGSAVHMAVLEPDLYAATYCDEPDLDAIGGARPRATREYKDQLAELAAGGQMVLKPETRFQVEAMAACVRSHPKAALLLARAPERELTLVWDRDGRACRGRADMLGANVLADLKTTRSLARFNPFELTRYGYYRQAAWYRDGLKRLGRPVQDALIIAVESAPPFDVGVFAIEEGSLYYGERECDRLIELLDRCETTGAWPGMFPEVAVARITDQLAAEMSGAEDAA